MNTSTSTDLPTYVDTFDTFINVTDFVINPITVGVDPGLVKIQNLYKKWMVTGTRLVNQYTFNKVEQGSMFTKDELTSMTTYMWSVSNITKSYMPSEDYPIDCCWLSNAGTIQKSSGRYRISHNGHYYFNYRINATVMFGPAVNGEWSHLCNNKRCERPSHLCDEPHKYNVDRNKCPGSIYFPDIDKVLVLCKHAPKKCRHIRLVDENDLITVKEYKSIL
jgi:hypothetical protein